MRFPQSSVSYKMQIDSYFVAQKTGKGNGWNGVIIPTESGKVAEAEMVVAYHQWAGDLAEKPFRIVAGPFLSEWEAIDQAKKLGIDAGVEPCVLSELVSG